MASALLDLPSDLRDRLTTGREMARRQPASVQREALATGLEPLDRLLLGGLPRGEVVEMRGARSSGRFSCVLALLGTVLATGEVAALIDLGDQLSPSRARRREIDLERLLWIRPRDLREALSAAEILLSGRFPLVVLDLGIPPVPGGRGREASWRRLARAARRGGGSLLVSSPYRVTGSNASEVLELHRGSFLWRGTGSRPRLGAGLEVRVERSKSRREPRGARARLRLWSEEEAAYYLGGSKTDPSPELDSGTDRRPGSSLLGSLRSRGDSRDSLLPHRKGSDSA